MLLITAGSLGGADLVAVVSPSVCVGELAVGSPT